MFPALIADWRVKFELPDLFFNFVQLAAYGWHDYTHLRQAQLAALQLPNVGMATAIDLGDMKSPNGGIHPRSAPLKGFGRLLTRQLAQFSGLFTLLPYANRLKQEVGRRLALTARALLYMEPGVIYEGPRLQGVAHTNRNRTQLVLTFDPATSQGLHLGGTANCQNCCAQPPSKPYFWAVEVQAPNGSWVGAHAKVKRNTVTVTSSASISGVRSGYGGMPDCLLYNGAGGGDNHSGIVAQPFRHCLYGVAGALPSSNWLSDCEVAPAREIVAPTSTVTTGITVTVPSTTMADFIFGATKLLQEQGKDSGSSGVALQTGPPKGGASWSSTYLISCDHPIDGTTIPKSTRLVVDSVSVSFRYRAAPLNSSTNNTAAILKLSLTNNDNRPVAAVGSVSLGNFSGGSNGTGYSKKVVLSQQGLKASCSAGLGNNPRGRLRLQFAVTNNDRPVTIPLDDLAGGFNIELRWKAENITA